MFRKGYGYGAGQFMRVGSEETTGLATSASGMPVFRLDQVVFTA